MRIILFGTGDYYQKFKDWFYDEDIVCLLDNNEQKQNTVIDGKTVLSPDKGIKLAYDKICVMSVYYEKIKEQLIRLGVRESDIVHCSELYRHPQMLRLDRIAIFYDKFGDIVSKILNTSRSIILMSHDLDLNGATLALYYAACILKSEGYDVWFASWTDGEIRKMLKEKEIGVIVDPRLQLEVFSEIEWLQSFQFIWCNTLLYYQLLSDRDGSKKYVWWLHEPEMFYQSVDKKILAEVRTDNLKIYAVGSVARDAFLNVCPQGKVTELLYGIPDVAEHQSKNADKDSIMEIITVGNVQEYKGQDILIDAIKQLPEEAKKKIHVSIIGGNNSAYYHSVVTSAEELENIIDFIPPINRDKIYKYYKNADLYICSSRQDCMPVVVAESMMYSIPSIVSDTTGIASYVRQCKGGLLFQSSNVQELSKKILWCLNNREQLYSMGKAARTQYENNFSLSSFKQNILKIVHNYFEI